jgi:hypothetical protein
VPTIGGVAVGTVIPVGGTVDATVQVDLALAAGNDCQGDIFQVVLDIDVTS